jgi:ubiquinone/menaquinone biosynthesis C-methylase UbiE
VALGNLREEVVSSWARGAVMGQSRSSFLADAARIVQTARAMAENQSLFERLLEPVHPALRASPRDDSFASTFAGSVWSFQDMLPYFFVDWAGERDPARDLLCDDARRYAVAGGTALVIGSGAGGLAVDLAEHYGPTTGVDRSIGSLLLARELANGAEVRCHVEQAEWAAVTLQGRRPPGQAPRWVAGDATRLPFADESFDLVVTQYIFDIVPDPARVIREINRVLRRGGTWSSLGLPFRLRTDPEGIGGRMDADTPPLAEALGFEAVAVERCPCVHLDLRRLTPWAGQTVHAVVHSVARKREHLARSDEAAATARYFAGERGPLLAMIPSVPQAGVHLTRPIVGSGGRTELRAGKTYLLRDEKVVAQALSFFDAIDGARSVEAVAAAMRACARPVPERDMVLALSVLSHGGGVDLQ